MIGRRRLQVVLVILSVASLLSAQDCSAVYEQCGGVDYTGLTNCCEGNYCSYQNDYYSQCLPDSDGTNEENCAAVYAQCGGKDYTGLTNCCQGNFCRYQDEYYSQCRPDSEQETSSPTPLPTPLPSVSPTDAPTDFPTEMQTNFPTDSPTNFPTDVPTDYPTEIPTNLPMASPTNFPTDAPTVFPTELPTKYSTLFPSAVPTQSPTDFPTDLPTAFPTSFPTELPTDGTPDSSTPAPTNFPTISPTKVSSNPSFAPTDEPTSQPISPNEEMSSSPSSFQSPVPSQFPTPSTESGNGDEGDELPLPDVTIVFGSAVILGVFVIMLLTLRIFTKTQKDARTIQRHPSILIKLASRSSSLKESSGPQRSKQSSFGSGFTGVGSGSHLAPYDSVSNFGGSTGGRPGQRQLGRRTRAFISPEARLPTTMSTRVKYTFEEPDD
eukprot:augustus_masked-scaffold_5-processed-gene-10.46-mRNA-1 protein AED:0.43 eAED:0.43 QI:0/-1/0/1/-1/1/1/0/436